MSMKLTPAAATSTTSCPASGLGSGSSVSFMTSGPPSCSITTARIQITFLSVGQGSMKAFAGGIGWDPAGSARDSSSSRMASRCDSWPAAGLVPPETGTATPDSTSSVRAVVSVSTSPNAGAAASRAVSAGRPQRCSTVFRIEVWSSGVPPAGARYTVPGAISGEMSTVGTRTPNRVKSKLNSPAVLSGGVAPQGGARWSVAAAVLVVGEHEQRLRPAGTGPQRLVHIVDELLAQGHVVVGVLAVAGGRPARAGGT